MFAVTTEQSFDAAHFLAGYQGKCSNLHGHRWRVLITVTKNEIEESGMVVDFTDLKDDLKKETDLFDHVLIVEKDTLKPLTYQVLSEEGFHIVQMDFRPTAENFAKYFYDKMKEKGYLVQSAIVYETPNNCAEYREG